MRYADGMDKDAARTWIEACAHGLQKHWPRIDPLQLEEAASELWENKALRPMTPSDAVALWLRPIQATPRAAGQPVDGPRC